MSRFNTEKMTVGDIQVSVLTEGPEDDAEQVHMHMMNEAAKAMQAIDEDAHPDECDGQSFTVKWGTDE